jgi:dUTP pyrophosphatase
MRLKMNTTKILFKKHLPNAVMPFKGSAQAAAFDLTAAETTKPSLTTNQVTVDTGLSVAFDEAFVLLVFGRSGFASKHGIQLANGVGVIDADYRGPLKLVFKTTGSILEMEKLLAPGNRVGQAILLPIPQVAWEEAAELPESIRGTGGFGSTGL